MISFQKTLPPLYRAMQPFVFVENVGVETHGQAERFEKGPGLCGEHGVVPCA